MGPVYYSSRHECVKLEGVFVSVVWYVCCNVNETVRDSKINVCGVDIVHEICVPAQKHTHTHQVTHSECISRTTHRVQSTVDCSPYTVVALLCCLCVYARRGGGSVSVSVKCICRCLVGRVLCVQFWSVMSCSSSSSSCARIFFN